jgi:hypothetical protein
MPLFEPSSTTLNLTTVLATWLVLNYRFLMAGATEDMLKAGEFGFHSFAQDNLPLYKNEIRMGMLTVNLKPCTFKVDDFQDLLHKSHGKPVEVMVQESRKRKNPFE